MKTLLAKSIENEKKLRNYESTLVINGMCVSQMSAPENRFFYVSRERERVSIIDVITRTKILRELVIFSLKYRKIKKTI